MERRLTAKGAWTNAQLVIGKTSILDYILDAIYSVSKQGYLSFSFKNDVTNPDIRIIELFGDKDKSDYVVDTLESLGYNINFSSGIYGSLNISWRHGKPS